MGCRTRNGVGEGEGGIPFDPETVVEVVRAHLPYGRGRSNGREGWIWGRKGSVEETKGQKCGARGGHSAVQSLEGVAPSRLQGLSLAGLTQGSVRAEWR